MGLWPSGGKWGAGGEQKGRALPLTALPSCSSPADTAQNEAISSFVLFTRVGHRPAPPVHRVESSLRRRNLLFRSIIDQKSNKIYIRRRPQVRSECASGHIWARIKGKFPQCTPWLYLTNPASSRALVTATDIYWKVFWAWEEGFAAAFQCCGTSPGDLWDFSFRRVLSGVLCSVAGHDFRLSFLHLLGPLSLPDT